MAMIDIRRRCMTDSPTEQTVTGNPATFTTNLRSNIRQMLCPFSPVQSSGTPSPSNVLPITGFNGVTVYRTGENLFDEQYPDIVDEMKYRSIFVGDGDVTFSTTMPRRSETVTNLFVLPGQVTTGAVSTTNGIADVWPRTVTPVDGWVTIAYRKFKVDPREYNTMCNRGTTASPYSPYTGNTYPVTFPAEVGTAYGGSLDLATGVLTVDKGHILVKDIPWDEYNSTFQRFMGTVSGIKLYPNARETPLSCSYFQVIDDKRAIGDVPNNSIYGAQNGRQISIKTTDYTTIEPFVENYGNCQIVYPLETPITYQLTPQQIATLTGGNVVWSNTNGTNMVKYLKK